MHWSVGVVIPARNDAAALRTAVASVLEQTYGPIQSIVLAIGPSSDDTHAVAAQLAADHPVVRIVDNPSGRTAAGLNRAVDATAADVVVRVDARSILPKQYVSHALESLRETNAANVGAVQRPVGQTNTERAIAGAMTSRFGSGGVGYRHGGSRRQVDTAYLGVFRRDAFLQVGGYDERFTRNQDAELNARLREAGFEVWLDPRLVVDYQPRPSISSLASQYWQYGIWRVETIRRHPESLRLRQVAAPIIVVGLVVSVALAALVSPWWLAGGGAYLVAIAAVALLGGEGPLHQRLTTAMALITMHISWGCGFLRSWVRGPGG